jgi:hypothetical protein
MKHFAFKRAGMENKENRLWENYLPVSIRVDQIRHSNVNRPFVIRLKSPRSYVALAENCWSLTALNFNPNSILNEIEITAVGYDKETDRSTPLASHR